MANIAIQFCRSQFSGILRLLTKWQRYQRRPFSIALLGLILVYAAVVRLLAARGDLWLDEIWSLELAHSVSSTWHLLTRVHQDNNHLLNTLCMRLVGLNAAPFLYRLPAVAAGIASVCVGGLMARRWGRLESVTVMVLLASSYPLVHYSSEARGYAFLVLFSLAAVHTFLRVFETESPTRRDCMAFAACCLGGFLSHPLFVHLWIPSVMNTLILGSGRNENLWQRLRLAVDVHAMPLAAATCLYWLHWRGTELGGGPDYDLGEKLAQTGSVVLGGPLFGGWAVALALVTGLSVTAGIIAMRARSHRAALLLAAVVAIPMIQAIVAHPPFLFVRYFLVAVLFATIAISCLLAKWYRHGTWGRAAYAVGLLGFLAANTWQIGTLATMHRGQYLAAISWIAGQPTTSDSIITISSDHDFGVSKLLRFYWPQARSLNSFQYVRGTDWPNEGPQWLVLHWPTDEPPREIASSVAIDGVQFVLERVFPCAGLSGWSLACYRRVATVPET